MQASRLTDIATWLSSSKGIRPSSNLGNRLPSTPWPAAISHRWLDLSCATSCSGWSATSISMTIRRACVARSERVCTTIPSDTGRMQEATRVRSPSTSTIQARQLPSARYPGSSRWHKCGIIKPWPLVTSQIVCPTGAETSAPSRVKVTVFDIGQLLHIYFCLDQTKL